MALTGMPRVCVCRTSGRLHCFRLLSRDASDAPVDFGQVMTDAVLRLR